MIAPRLLFVLALGAALASTGCERTRPDRAEPAAPTTPEVVAAPAPEAAAKPKPPEVTKPPAAKKLLAKVERALCCARVPKVARQTRGACPTSAR